VVYAVKGIEEHGALRVAAWSLRFAVLTAFAFALAACSKCDMPGWNSSRTPSSCHDDAAVK